MCVKLLVHKVRRPEISGYKGKKTYALSGSITIYLILSLVLVMAVIFSLAESARVCCINAKLKSITYMAADSCFSEFAREIFDEYGIMGLWKNDAELKKTFDTYVQGNISMNGADTSGGADLYLMNYEQSSVSDIERLADDAGAAFDRQVYEYMDLYQLSEIAEMIPEYAQIYEQAEETAAFMDVTIENINAFIGEALAAANIQKASDRVKSMGFDPADILSQIRYGLEGFLEEEDSSWLVYYDQGCQALQTGKETLKGYLKQIADQTRIFDEQEEKAQTAVGEMREILVSCSEEQQLKEQITQLDTRTSSDSGIDHYIRENEKAAADSYDRLVHLDNLKLPSSAGLYAGNAAYLLSDILYYENLFRNSDLQVPGLGMKEYPGEKQDTEFMFLIRRIFTDDVLKSLISDNISENEIITSLEIPGNKTENSEHRDLQYGDYITAHFGCFTEPAEDNALKYEEEYIISGERSDKDNLEAVVKKLLHMRSGLNISYLRQDEQKIDEARTMAQMVIGYTGIKQLEDMVMQVIINIWSIAESLCYLKAFMSGEKAGALKAADNWAVRMEDLGNFSESLVPAVSDKTGISYRDLLRILLYQENSVQRTFRVMDIIQANACKKYNPQFDITKCVVSAQFHASFSAKALFSGFGSVRNIAVGVPGGYSFSFVQKYSYTDTQADTAS